jgi:DNA-binding CsgD family transcriptional regulator/HD-like signal output (HDOD) protein
VPRTADAQREAPGAVRHLRGHGGGSDGRAHGRRLEDALRAVEGFPVLVESRERLVAALSGAQVDRAAVLSCVEADLGLGLAVLRAAGGGPGRTAGPASVAAAVHTLPAGALHVIADSVRVVDFFDRSTTWSRAAVASRRHVAQVQAAIDDLVRLDPALPLDELYTAALLHDVGKAVLAHAHDGVGEARGADGTPEERLAAERRAFGMDHAVVAGVLLRRWSVSPVITRMVEGHHGDGGDRATTALRLADLLAHRGVGDPVRPGALLDVGARLGLDRDALSALIHDRSGASPRRGAGQGRSPLSQRETEVLLLLAGGRRYEEIAEALDIATSTARTHLHNIYGKLEVANRTQAVLLATERGWVGRTAPCAARVAG